MQFLCKVMEAAPMIRHLQIEFVEAIDAAPLVKSVEALRQVRTVSIEDFSRSGVRGASELLAGILRSSHTFIEEIRVSWRSPSQPPTSSQIAMLSDALSGCSGLDEISLGGSYGR